MIHPAVRPILCIVLRYRWPGHALIRLAFLSLSLASGQRDIKEQPSLPSHSRGRKNSWAFRGGHLGRDHRETA